MAVRDEHVRSAGVLIAIYPGERAGVDAHDEGVTQGFVLHDPDRLTG